MAKVSSGQVSSGRATTAKVKKASPAASVGNAKPAATAPKRKVVASKISAKAPVAKRALPRGKAAADKAPAPKSRVATGPARRKAATAGKAVPSTPGSRRSVPATTAVGLKEAPGRRPAAQARAPRRAPNSTPIAAPQAFTVSHLNHADFKADGLRTYAQYRDLGIAAATGGRCQAHVIRFIPPCTDEVRRRHRHEAELQLVYVLQGWMKNEFEGHGEQMMSAGSCWLQPAGIKHTVLDYSVDCEVLEIIVPADFKTEETT